MIDFNSLNKFLEKQIDDISENIIPIASEKEMLDANFAIPHTYKVVITPTSPSTNNHGSSVSLTRIFINDDTDYLKVKTVKTDSTCSATVDMTENSTQKSTYPMTISSDNTYGDRYKVYNSLADASWVWLASGISTITYSFDCMNISNFRFQPNWNGYGGGGVYYKRCCRGCAVKVYCDDKLIFDKSFSSLDYSARINLKFSDYETCTSFIDNGPGDW